MALDEARAILEGKGFRLNPVETTRLRLLEGSDARQSVRVPASLGMTGSIGNGVTDAGGIIRISARPDGVIWDVQYDYHYNREGPYGDYEGLLAALEERTLGAVPVRRDWEGGSVSYYFYDPDMTPRTDITCKNCSAYFPSLSDSWEKVNEDEGKTTGGDYAVFHSQVYAGEDRGRKYVTKMAFRSRNMGLIVPYLEALYRGLQSATRTQTKPVDF